MYEASLDGVRLCADEAEKRPGYVCPGCSLPVILKAGRVKVRHFSHLPGAYGCPICNETMEHLAIKKDVYQDALKRGWRARTEWPIGQSRTDVAIILPDRRCLAVEIQLSPIDEDTMLQRMEEHTRHGFSTVWLLNSYFVDALKENEDDYNGDQLILVKKRGGHGLAGERDF